MSILIYRLGENRDLTTLHGGWGLAITSKCAWLLMTSIQEGWSFKSVIVCEHQLIRNLINSEVVQKLVLRKLVDSMYLRGYPPWRWTRQNSWTYADSDDQNVMVSWRRLESRSEPLLQSHTMPSSCLTVMRHEDFLTPVLSLCQTLVLVNHKLCHLLADLWVEETDMTTKTESMDLLVPRFASYTGSSSSFWQSLL